MGNEKPSPRRATFEKGIRIGEYGWFGRLSAVVVSTIVLVAAAMLSVVLLAVLFAVGVIVAGYLWWRIRALRRQAREFGDDGRTVDVEVVHKDSPGDDITKR
jgi:membrane protein implicated in regulation of membrane protease activity